MASSAAGYATAAHKPTPISELVVDAGTGRTLFSVNADQPWQFASLAKLMPRLLVVEALGYACRPGSILAFAVQILGVDLLR